MLSVVCRRKMTQSQPDATCCAHVPFCIEAYVYLLFSPLRDLCHVNGKSGCLTIVSRRFSRILWIQLVLFFFQLSSWEPTSLLTTSVISNRVKLLNTRTPDDPTNIRPLTYGSRGTQFLQFLKPSWYVAQLLSEQVPEGPADIYKISCYIEPSVKPCEARILYG